jgi:glutamate dehydrogenase (NAD(P)+)
LRHAEGAARGVVGALQMIRGGATGSSDIGLAVSVQGTRPLAQLVARRIAEIGGIVRALAWTGGDDGPCTVERQFGVTPTELTAVTEPSGGLDRRRAARLGYAVLAADGWLTQPVDALILTGAERRLRVGDVERLHPRVRFVVEGTHGLLDPEVDERLTARGITVIPDLLAAVGRLAAHDVFVHGDGATDRDAVAATADRAVTAAVSGVLADASNGRQTLRDAAYAVALRRVLADGRDGGWL